MKQNPMIAFTVALTLSAAPSMAQDGSGDDGSTLMERGMELFFEGLREEMSPTLETLRGMADEFGPAMARFWSEMGPAFGEVLDEVQDWTRYHPPEILPNGDIIMRKKAAPEPAPDTTPAPQSQPPAGSTDI